MGRASPLWAGLSLSNKCLRITFKNEFLGKIWSILKFSSKDQRVSNRLRSTLWKRASAGASKRIGLGPSAQLLSGCQDSILTWCHLTPKAGAGHVAWISAQFSPGLFSLVFRTRKWDGKTVHLLGEFWWVSGAAWTVLRRNQKWISSRECYDPFVGPGMGGGGRGDGTHSALALGGRGLCGTSILLRSTLQPHSWVRNNFLCSLYWFIGLKCQAFL